MRQVEYAQSFLFSLSPKEVVRLTQGVALNLLIPPVEVRHDESGRTLVRFRSHVEVERVRALIA